MTTAPLQADIEQLFDHKPDAYTDEHFRLFYEFKDALNQGASAPPSPSSAPSGWRSTAGSRRASCSAFDGRCGGYVDRRHAQPFMDKSTFPVKRFHARKRVRIVPGGSSVRDASTSQGVTCMPPCTSTWARTWTMALWSIRTPVGSARRSEELPHLGRSQIGGVLEPVGALPVIVEDEVLVGGNCGVYEGAVVKKRAVLGTARSSIVPHLSTTWCAALSTKPPTTNRSSYRKKPSSWPAHAPSPWARKRLGHFRLHAGDRKIRDSRTDTKIQLEDVLR